MSYNNDKKEPSHANTFDLTQKDDSDGDKNEIIVLLSDDDDDDDEVIVDRVVSAPPRNRPLVRSQGERDTNTAAAPSNQQTKRRRMTQGDATKDYRPEKKKKNCRTEKSPPSSLARSSDVNHDNQHNPIRPVGKTTSPAVHRPLDGRTGQQNDGCRQGDKYNMKKNPFPHRRTLELPSKSTVVQQQRQEQQAKNMRTVNNNDSNNYSNNNSSAAQIRRRSNSPPARMAPPPYTRVSAMVDPHKKNRGSRCEANVGQKHKKCSVSKQQSANFYREDVRNNKNSSNPHPKRRYPESENSSRHRTSLGSHVLQKLRPGDNDRLHRTTSQNSKRHHRDSRFNRKNAPFPSQRQMGGTFSSERPLGGVAVHPTRHAQQSRQNIAQATSTRNCSPTRNPSSSYPRAASAPHSREHQYQSTQVPDIRDDIPKRRYSLIHLGKSSPKSSEESSKESTTNARPSRQEVIEIPDSSSSSSSWSVDEEDDTNTRKSDLLARPNSIVSSMLTQNSLKGTKRRRPGSSESNDDGRDECNDRFGEYNESTALKAAFYAQRTEGGHGNTKQNSPSRDEIRRRRIIGAGLRVNPKGGRSTRALTSYSPQLEKKPPPLSTMQKKTPLAPVSAVRGTRATPMHEKRSAGLKSPDLRGKQASQFDETSKNSIVEKTLVIRPKGGGSLGHEQTVAEQTRQALCGNESFQAVARDEGVGSVVNELLGDKYSYQKPRIPAQKARKIQLPDARHCQNRTADSTIHTDSVSTPGEPLSNQENPQRPAEKGRAIESLEQPKPVMYTTLHVESLQVPSRESPLETATSGSELLLNLTNSPPVSTDSASESDKDHCDKNIQQPPTDETDAPQSFKVCQRTIEETAPLLDPPIHRAFEECTKGPAVSDEDLFSKSSDTPADGTKFSSGEITSLFEESLPQNVVLAARSGCMVAEDKTRNAVGDKDATKKVVPHDDADGDEDWYVGSQSTVQSSPNRTSLSAMYDSIFQIEPRRERLTVKVRDLGVGDEIDYTQITTVEHLTKDYIDERGLPVKEMVVYGGSDSEYGNVQLRRCIGVTVVSHNYFSLSDILYRIRLHVEDTKFGYGAFLTYIGALRLKRSEQVRGDRMIAKREPYFPETTQLLDVIDVDGWEKTLRITGENLHGNNNNCYWPRHMIPIKAVKKTPSHIHTFFLKPTGHSCYVSDEDEEDAKYVEAKLREMKSKGLKPVGHLGIYSVEDYFPDQNVAFQLHGNVIDIGRYGPWRNQGNSFMLT